MKVAHFTVTMSRNGGGVAQYVRQLCDVLQDLGATSNVVCIDDGRTLEDAGEAPGIDRLLVCKATGPRFLGFSLEAFAKLRQIIAGVDVVHIHAIRSLLEWQAWSVAAATGRPVIISPHGQLLPWALERTRGRKWISDRLWVKRGLRRAAAVHAVSNYEAHSIRAFLPEARVRCIPLGLHSSWFAGETASPVRFVSASSKSDKPRIVLFCAVWTARKGIYTLLEAWSRVAANFPGARLVLAGVDPLGERARIEGYCAQQKTTGSVTILGEVAESDKRALFQSVDLFVLPSLAEAFGISVVEALSQGVPAITTHCTPWSVLPEKGCGWWVPADCDAISGALLDALALPEAELRDMGRRAKALAAEDYQWTDKASQVLRLYESVLTS